MALGMHQDTPGLKSFVRGNQKGLSCGEVIKCVLDITDEGWNIYHFIDRNGPKKIYLFGFSRGAATVRSLSAFISMAVRHS